VREGGRKKKSRKEGGREGGRKGGRREGRKGEERGRESKRKEERERERDETCACKKQMGFRKGATSSPVYGKRALHKRLYSAKET